MAVHQLLVRGMLVGILAGLFAFGFARLLGEPSVSRAVAFEEAHSKTEAASSEHAHGARAPAGDHGANAEAAVQDDEIFSRTTQSGIGLLSGMALYGGALGGLFALVFAACYGRIGRLTPQTCAAVLALLGFVAIYVVPGLKYPANPPSIGAPSTIGARTGLYFSMMVVSLVAMMTAFSLGRLLTAKLGAWNAGVCGAAVFVGLTAIATTLLPSVDEVPSDFPADLLWNFRLASFGIQATFWTIIGLLFGTLTERASARR